MKERIWAALLNVEYKKFIMEILYDRFQKRDRNINIFLAIASSTSIAAWVIWKEYAILWSVIIALSQVVTVVKPYFPFYKYVKELSEKMVKLDSIGLDYERMWDRLSSGKITVDEAAELYYDLKERSNQILTFSDDTIFDVTKKMQDKADANMATFLKNNYRITMEKKK